MKSKCTPLPLRIISSLLSAVMAFGPSSGFALASTASEPVRQIASTPALSEQSHQVSHPVQVNRRPLPQNVSSSPQFSEQPTPSELFEAHIFSFALVPVGNPTAQENKALAEALVSYVKRSNADDQSILLEFLSQYPNSAWKPALLLNLGIVWRHAGYFSRAITAWQEGWELSKNETELAGKALADQILSELIQIHAWVGDRDRMDSLLSETENRQIIGGGSETIPYARNARWMMDNKSDEMFKCGPYALRQILWSTRTNADATRLFHMKSSPQGFSLSRLQQLATESGMAYQMARRNPGSAIPANSVVHWKLGHYGVVVREEQGRYLVRDTTLTGIYGPEMWVSKAALEEESDGYFLVPVGSVASGWKNVTEKEGQNVFGKGDSPNANPDAFTPDDDKTCDDPDCCGMARASAHLMLVSLNIMDTPLGYNPPVGPAVDFTITYNQRDYTTQIYPNYSNLGVCWVFNWFSYIADNGIGGSRDSVSRYVSGGGVIHHNGYVSGTGLYSADRDGKVLQYLSDSDTYELTLPDGSKQIFGYPDTTNPGARRMYLTAITDPAGNAVEIGYDELGRISQINDALDQTTTLYYDLDGTYAQYKITRVEDPFGRTALFEYDQFGRLKKSTDVSSISSAFEYDEWSFGFIKKMTTPYGASTFNFSEGSDGYRSLTMTDPNGDSEKAVFQNSGYCPPDSEFPSGKYNQWLQYRNTFYFDKKAYQMSNHGNDLSYATVYHWLHGDNGTSELVESIKPPLESRIWFSYLNQNDPHWDSTITLRRPVVISRVVDDPNNPNNYVTQTYQLGYNNRGSVTNYIDPAGRRIALDYDSNGVDLKKVRQTTGTADEVLAEFGTYNSQHRPATYTDAARQTYILDWNSRGQLTDITNPKSQLTHLDYYTDGHLHKIQKPWFGGTKTTSWTYDDFGRIRTVTYSDGYSLTYDYDDLDRMIRVTYPDQTFEQYVYDRLDLTRAYDRTGKHTDITYDNVGRPVSVVDRLSRTNLFGWCSCAGLDSITDPLGHVTTWIRDVEGRVTQKIYDDSTTAQYVYDNRGGNMKSITDAEYQVKNYTYNMDDTLKSVTYTAAKVATPSVSFTYDPNYRRLYTITDGTGQTTFDYRPITAGGTLGAGKLASVDGPLANDTITYQYDELNRMTNRAINGVNEAVVYDDLGRMTNHTSVLGAFTYSYVNDTRRLNSLVYPNGLSTIYDYFDNQGDRRLKEIWNKNISGGTVSRFDYAYDVLGRISQWTQQTGATTTNVITLDYDNEDQLLGALIGPQGQALTKTYGYGYDAAGNRTNETMDVSSALTVTMAAYNNINKLTSQGGTGPLPVRFYGKINEAGTVTVNGAAARMTQDRDSQNNGKIFSKTLDLPMGGNTVTIVATDFGVPPNVTTTNYSLTVAGGQGRTFAYDLNGNLTNVTTATTTNSYAWDAENRLVKFTQLTNNTELTSEFTYDGFGRRVQIVEKNNGTPTSTKQFIWSGAQTCEERDQYNSVTKRFFAEGEQNVGGVNLYFFRDHLGSIREAIGPVGAIRARYDYDPYGRRMKMAGNLEADFGFTGYYVHQPSGLQLALYRAYDADLGRFINRDPIGEEGGINLYDYVQNDPINAIDPLGLFGAGQRCWEKSKEKWKNRVTSPRHSQDPMPGFKPPKGHSDFTGGDEFDFTREDNIWEGESPYPIIGRVDLHFQSYEAAISDVEKALETGKQHIFERAMHRLQDPSVHYEKGYEPPLGHAIDSLLGKNPDNDPAAWEEAEARSKPYVEEWYKKWGHPQNKSCGCK